MDYTHYPYTIYRRTHYIILKEKKQIHLIILPFYYIILHLPIHLQRISVFDIMVLILSVNTTINY